MIPNGPGGQPSPQELAAIVAAVAAVWPQPAPAPVAKPVRRAAGWRFSGRWWAPDDDLRPHP